MKKTILILILSTLAGCGNYYFIEDYEEKPINTTIEELNNSVLVTSTYSNSTKELLIEQVNANLTILTANHSIEGVEYTCIEDVNGKIVIKEC